MGFLDALFGLNQGQPLIDAANQNKSAISKYNTTANNLIDTGASSAGGYLQQILDQYAPLAKEAGAAGNMYADALGLNGAEGNDAATAAYQASPGYQFALDQGLQALDRTAASRGALGGGGLTADTLKYATGLANQDYGSWLDRLANPGILLTGLQGKTAGLGSLADLATGTAGQKVGIAGDVVNGTMGANNQIATGQQENNAGLSNLFGNILGGVGKLAGASPLGTFLSGYGGF